MALGSNSEALGSNSESLQEQLLDERNGNACGHGSENCISASILCSADDSYCRRVLVESKKLWRIAGPAIFSRLAIFGMNVITVAFVGHLGNLELAATSMAVIVIFGFNFGLIMGLASALGTLCGQAYGAQEYHMMGVYMQRSCIVLFVIAVLLLPIYIFATPILKLIGQSDDIADLSGTIAIWLIPLHFSCVLLAPVQRFLQSQLKNMVITWFAGAILMLHIVLSWVFIFKLDMGVIGAAMALDISWWVFGIGLFLYVICGGCPQTWTGLSSNAFTDLWPFVKLSVASGVMLCLETWYYRVLVVLTGNLSDPQVAVDSLSICMNVNSLEMMIPIGFFIATSVRVGNELGAGNGRGAKFAVIVSAGTSSVIGVVFWALILMFRQEFALVFTSSSIIIEAVSRLAILLAFTILLNSVQPVLSGVAVGSGWQSTVAYINIGCYYAIGIPFGVLLGWLFHMGVRGIWTGMICGTAIQTLILAYLIYRCDWELQVTKAIERVNTWSRPHDRSQEPRAEGGTDGFSQNQA